MALPATHQDTGKSGNDVASEFRAFSFRHPLNTACDLRLFDELLEHPRDDHSDEPRRED